MKKICTEAWVLYSSKIYNEMALKQEKICFDDIQQDEVLALPLFGCLEGNILHAIERNPIDICIQRNEDKIILGNAGVVVIEKVGSSVKALKPGDYCIFFCNAENDAYGFPLKIAGYDAPNSIGIFAKRIKLHEKQAIPIPKNITYSLPQWAAFSLRYITAWSNWIVAYNCWRSQMKTQKNEEMHVFGWGGGVAFAELSLANYYGCKVYMTTQKPERISVIKDAGIFPIDLGQFKEFDFEKEFLNYINQVTNGEGASIFIDNIGGNLAKITLKSLARQGVISTCGWKNGTIIPILRPLECINRHIHVHTHYATYDEGIDAINFAVANNWMPPAEDYVFSWEEIPQLLEEYKNNRLISYFPIFSINKI
jgi:NADPH:quinone reductase-like Zn-dependent oxidoreductase